MRRFKKLLCLLLSLCVLALPVLAAEESGETVTSGTCGENVTWTLEDGVLTISGTGNMVYAAYEDTKVPWSSSREQITAVVIEEGVTSIEDFAFYNCISLTSVSIPDSVTSIGDFAFRQCHSLTSISIPNSVTSLGFYSFTNCTSLRSVSISNGITGIEECTFMNCSSLASVFIPGSVKTIGNGAFDYCDSLTDIYYGGGVNAWYNQISIGYDNERLYTAALHENAGDSLTAEELAVTENDFSDVPSGAYYIGAVSWAVENGVTTGTSTTTFSPDATVTRAQAVTFVWRAYGSPEPESTTSPFTDVTDSSAYYYKAVLWAAGEGIINGIGNNQFGLNGTLTYDQILAILSRMMGVTAYDGDWSASAMQWGALYHVTDGLDISAKDNCPRCDVVYFLWRRLG